jgi:hypothetical protein
VSCVGDIGGRPNYKLKTIEREDPVYPYESGDVVVIGPQCFAAKDGSVLNWRGENYVRQEPVKNPDPYEDYK